jgi:hypothetical protein
MRRQASFDNILFSNPGFRSQKGDLPRLEFK